MMETRSAVKHKVLRMLDRLPSDGLKELGEFLDFLQDKYGTEHAGQVVALGGLWQDIPFDISDDDIRALRHQVGAEVLGGNDDQGMPD